MITQAPAVKPEPFSVRRDPSRGDQEQGERVAETASPSDSEPTASERSEASASDTSNSVTRAADSPGHDQGGPGSAPRTPVAGATGSSGPPVESLLREVAPRPRSGWRALAYDVTGGRWNPGPSAAERQEREREQRIAQHLRGRHVTAFFCLKGGISKTSTTAATSLALADLRPDPVFAIDANPDAGDLAERLVGEAHAGISALAANIDSVRSLEDLSEYTVSAGRLTVLPGEPNPVLGDSLRAEDFERVLGAVATYYSLIQVDCGTGVTHPLMRGILAHTDTAVIPAAWSITGARRAAETIEWLSANGFEHLARTSIVVLTAKDIVSKRVDKDAVMRHLGKAADLVVVPADPHVADGAQLQWEQLQASTREAYLNIAAAITSRF